MSSGVSVHYYNYGIIVHDNYYTYYNIYIYVCIDSFTQRKST